MRRRLAAWPKSHSYCAISPQVGSVLAQYPPSPEYWLPPHCECGLIMGPWRTKLYYFNFSIYLLHRDRNQQIEPNQEFRIDPTMMIHRVSYIYVYNDPPPLSIFLFIHPSISTWRSAWVHAGRGGLGGVHVGLFLSLIHIMISI